MQLRSGCIRLCGLHKALWAAQASFPLHAPDMPALYEMITGPAAWRRGYAGLVLGMPRRPSITIEAVHENDIRDPVRFFAIRYPYEICHDVPLLAAVIRSYPYYNAPDFRV